MTSVLIIVQIIISVLLVTFILLQKNTDEGLLSGSTSASSIMGAKTYNTFLLKTTGILAMLFMLNAIVLANLSIPSKKSIIDKALEDKSNNYNINLEHKKSTTSPENNSKNNNSTKNTPTDNKQKNRSPR